jgi:hypothetical protein
MRFLINAQLPPALAQHLEHIGYEAVHVESIGLLTAQDREIWQRAIEIGAVLITKDEDFCHDARPEQGRRAFSRMGADWQHDKTSIAPALFDHSSESRHGTGTR